MCSDIHDRLLPEYSTSKSVDRPLKCARVVEVPRLMEYAGVEWYRYDTNSTVTVSLQKLQMRRLQITEYRVSEVDVTV